MRKRNSKKQSMSGEKQNIFMFEPYEFEDHKMNQI